jgi:hypothetical protein
MIAMKLKTIAIYFTFFLLPVIFFSPYLFKYPQPYILPTSDLGTDLTREVIPTATYLQDIFRSTGNIALWRPYLLSGAPLAGHPVFPLLYPPYWLVLALPISLALNLMAVLDFAWSTAGMFLLLRDKFGRSTLASFLGALVFGFSPRWVGYLSGGHWSMLAAVA